MQKAFGSKAEQSTTPWWLIWLLALLLIAAGAAGIGAYNWQHHKVNELKAEVSNLNAKIDSLKNQQPAASPTDHSAPNSSVSSVSYEHTSLKGVKIILYTPVNNAMVRSPVAVMGEAPGNWSFEASFPVVLKDSQGTQVAQGTAQMLGDWMTDKLVPFSAKLTYSSNPTGKGTLVLQKDNPSGAQANTDSVSIVVQF